MATMTGSVSSSGSGWKTGWDFFWREQREEVQKNLPKGLSFEEAKKELKRRLKEAWNGLSGSEKKVYERKVVSSAALGADETARPATEVKVHTKASSSAGSGAPCHAFFLGKSAKKSSVPAKENSPVENTVPKFNLDSSSTGTASQKRRATSGQKSKEPIPKPSIPRKFTSIRDAGNSSGSGGSGGSDSVKSSGDMGNVDRKKAKAGGVSAAPAPHSFFMTKEQKDAFKAEKRKEQEEEEERRRLKEIQENERRQQERMEEIKARRKQDATVFAAKGSGVNEFFVESEKRIAKEKALVAGHGDAGDNADDDRVETWANFPEVQNVGLTRSLESFLRSSNHSSSDTSATFMTEKRRTENNMEREAGLSLSNSHSMVVDLVAQEECEQRSLLKDRLVERMQASKGGPNINAYGEALSEFGMSDSVLRSLVGTLLESSVFGIDRVPSQAQERREAVVEAAKLRKQAHAREAQVVDLAADDDDDDCGNGGDGGGGGDAWDNKLVGCEGLTRSSGCVMDVLSGADKALVDMFEPRGKEDILGNDETKDELEQWLLGWAGKRAESKKEKKPRGKKRRRSNYCDSDSEEEDDAEANALDNVAAVWGPSGAGKTALVYALADRTGFNVIEIGASQLRSGSEINKRFQEAAKSQGLKLDASAASTPFSIAASAAKSPCKQKLNLILFDEADLEFEEDASMYKAMQSLIKTTRTPIIITAERHDRTNSPLSFLRSINAMDCPMQRPSPWQLGTLAMSILTNSLGLGSHNVPVAKLAATLAQIHSGDVRGCLHSLQLLIPSLLCDKTVLKSLKDDAKAGGESKLSLSLEAWLASSGALPVMIDRLVPTLKAALVENASLVSQSRSTDSALDSSSAAASHSKMQPLCAPLISDVSPRVGPRRGGHVVRVEGRHFLQRLQVAERGNVDAEDGDEAGAAPILPLVVFVGGTQLGAEHVAILSDVVLEIRVPALQAGLHVVSVALRVPTQHGTTTMLTSDVCGVSRAWIRVRPPPGKGDIRTFFTETNRANGGSGGRGLQLISDARVSTAMDRSRSRSGYVDDSDEEELQEERRRRLKLERESRGRNGKRGGGLKLVKGGARNKKARASEEGQGHAAAEMGHDKDRDKEAEVEEDIIDSDEDADCGEGGVKAVDGAAALRKKRRVLPDSSDDEEHGAMAVAMGHEGKKEEGDTEGQMTVEVQSSSFPSDAVRQLAATLSPEELKACMDASLDSVWDAGVTVPFLKPVDDNRLPDFARVVERPLDLGTIRETMDHYAVNGVFIPESLWDFVADVRLVWSNCILYDDSKFAPVEHAKLLSTAFDAAMRREVQEALQAVVDRDDNTAQSPLSRLSAEQVSSVKADVAAAAASLLPAGPVYSEVDEGDLADFGLCPAPLSQAAPADLRKHLLVAETARTALRGRTKAYSGPPAGQECDDVESNPVDLLPPPGMDCGRAERDGDCAGLEFLSSLLDCWSDAELLDAHTSLAPSRSDVQGELLHARSGAYTTSLLSSGAPSTLLGHHLERLLLPGSKGHDSERAVGAFVRAIHRCEDGSVLPPDRDAASPLVRYLLDARSEDPDPAQVEGQNSPSGLSEGGEEVAMALADEEEEEFDEGMFSAAAPPRAVGGRRGEGPSPYAINAHGAPSGWASGGTCFQSSSLRLSLQQREYSDFVSETLVPEYRFSGSKGPQRRVFDNLCLETRVSREIALDSFPYISKMLRAEASAPQALSERSSRRSAAAGNLQRFPYFYSKSNDMELHDMETILKLGSIPL